MVEKEEEIEDEDAEEDEEDEDAEDGDSGTFLDLGVSTGRYGGVAMPVLGWLSLGGFVRPKLWIAELLNLWTARLGWVAPCK